MTLFPPINLQHAEYVYLGSSVRGICHHQNTCNARVRVPLALPAERYCTHLEYRPPYAACSSQMSRFPPNKKAKGSSSCLCSTRACLRPAQYGKVGFAHACDIEDDMHTSKYNLMDPRVLCLWQKVTKHAISELLVQNAHPKRSGRAAWDRRPHVQGGLFSMPLLS